MNTKLSIMGRTHLHRLEHYQVPEVKENGKNCIYMEMKKETVKRTHSLYYILSDTGRDHAFQSA